MHMTVHTKNKHSKQTAADVASERRALHVKRLKRIRDQVDSLVAVASTADVESREFREAMADAKRLWSAHLRWDEKRAARMHVLEIVDAAARSAAVVLAVDAAARGELEPYLRDAKLPPDVDDLTRRTVSLILKKRRTPETMVLRKMLVSFVRFGLNEIDLFVPESRRTVDPRRFAQAAEVWLHHGGPRKDRKTAPKRAFFAELMTDLGLGPISPNGLFADWREWNRLLQERKTVRP